MHPVQHPIQNPPLNYFNNIGYQNYGNNSNTNNINNMKISNFIDQRGYQGHYQFNQDFNTNQHFLMKNKMNNNLDMHSNIGKYGGMNPQIPNNPSNMMGQNMKKNNQSNMQNIIHKNRVNKNNKMWNHQNNKSEGMTYGDKVIKKVKLNAIIVENKGNPLENCDELSKEDNEEDLQFSPSKSSNVKNY